MNKNTLRTAIFLLILSIGFFGISRNYKFNQKTLKANSLETTQNENNAPLDKLRIPIFMYHHIDYFNDSTEHERILTYIGTTSEKLRKQLDLLQKLGYETIVFKDVDEGNIPKKPIILTFDDSYDDFYTKAYPELLKRKMKAITYVITDKLNSTGYLTTDQLREMRNNGIEIASHTLSHPDLKTLTDEELKKEISDSKTFLEKLLNEKVLSFAYPFGKYNLRIRKVVEDAGYKYATTVNPGNASFKEPLDLQRYKVYSDTDINNYIK